VVERIDEPKVIGGWFEAVWSHPGSLEKRAGRSHRCDRLGGDGLWVGEVVANELARDSKPAMGGVDDNA